MRVSPPVKKQADDRLGGFSGPSTGRVVFDLSIYRGLTPYTSAVISEIASWRSTYVPWIFSDLDSQQAQK
jgi:hypothetical protein